MKKILAMIGAVCLILTACSSVKNEPAETTGETETSSVAEAETTASEGEHTEAETSETEAEETADVSSDDGEQEIGEEEDRIYTAKELLGALNYIDQIGGGNITKDEEKTADVDGRQFAKVLSEFANTSDLDGYMHMNLTDNLINSRYSGILGGDEPYYTDIDGELYGYVTAKGCGFNWIEEDYYPVVELKDSADDNYTITTKFDDYGAETEMEVKIVRDNGYWKIDSISYGGNTY